MTNRSAEIMAFSVPLTDELSRATYQFERPVLAAASIGVAVVSAYLGYRRDRQLSHDSEGQLPYADPDLANYAETEFRRERRATKVTGFLLAAGLGAATAQMAGPYVETIPESSNRVAVVFDAGLDTRVTSLTDSKNGKKVSVLEGEVNSGLRFARVLGDDVKVQFIAAGRQAESLGIVEGEDGAKEVVAGTLKYYDDIENATNPDIAGALALARANKPREVILMTSNDNVDVADAITDYRDDNITIVSPGKPGEEFNFLGQDYTAGYTSQFGDKMGIPVETTGELQDVMENRVKKMVDQPTRKENSYFYAVLSGAAITLGWLGLSKKQLLPKMTNGRIKGMFPRNAKGGKK